MIFQAISSLKVEKIKQHLKLRPGMSQVACKKSVGYFE